MPTWRCWSTVPARRQVPDVKRVPVRPLDVIAVIIAVGAVVGVTIFAYGERTPGSEVRIEGDGGVFLYTLDQPREVTVTGPIGETVVQISDGRVRVVSSPCRDKICVAAGWLESGGQWAACLPNRVFVRVEGSSHEHDEVDAQTY